MYFFWVYTVLFKGKFWNPFFNSHQENKQSVIYVFGKIFTGHLEGFPCTREGPKGSKKIMFQFQITLLLDVTEVQRYGGPGSPYLHQQGPEIWVTSCRVRYIPTSPYTPNTRQEWTREGLRFNKRKLKGLLIINLLIYF